MHVTSWLLVRLYIYMYSKLLFEKTKNIQQIVHQMEGFYQCEGNYVRLSPISFIERASFVYEKSPCIIYEEKTYTWKETRDRCVKLASALSIRGVGRGQVVSSISLILMTFLFTYFRY
ncbi:putative AMP-dependent synthetase-like superfamily [Helianthus anomalus]